MESSYTLGLDIGSNSVGWALLDVQGQQVVDVGVRIFQEGVDRDTKGAEVSKNETRRTARGARRSRQRRNYRKDKLLRLLRRNGLLPKDDNELQKVFDTDPYLLRAKGLDGSLTAYEFGRISYHINQRRGFWSNRKSGKSKDDGVVIKDATALNQAMEEAGCTTLGEYFSKINPHESRIRGHYTFRSMFEDEFELLWQTQSQYHDVLSDDLKRQVKDETIFFQRPLKWDPETIGDCELEPEHKRCPRGNYYARRFRILQTVNNLKIHNPDGTEQVLDEGQRQTVLDTLSIQKEPSFDAIRKKLNLMETQKFNFEEGSADKTKAKLKGDEFNAYLRGKKVLGPKLFDGLETADLIDINELVINDELSDEEVISALIEDYNFSEEQAVAVANVPLPSKYTNFSELAMQKLLPHMEKGLRTDEAVKKVYGDLQAANKTDALDRLPLPDDLRNPIVNKALFETRKVVNALIREYGKPKSIYVEMARDVKCSKRERDEIRLKQWKLEQENNEAREELHKEMNIPRPSRNDVIKYKLWNECGRICPYTGKSISQEGLFGKHPEFQIEHILPYSRTLDDSYMNKTLCWVHENIDKGNDTPYEYYAESKPEQWEQILQRIKLLPYPKRRKFWQKEVELDEFIKRQLNDTRYITKEVVRYLKMLNVTVWGTKGQITSELRHQWGLNEILDFTGAGLKNRDDHRHHAVDAAVTAMTRNEHLHTLAGYKYHKDDLKFDLPWPDFRKQLEEKVNQINVSHRVTRKVSGQLHEETAYGPTGLKDEKGQDIFVYRKSLDALTLPMVQKIVDPVVREIVTERLLEFGIDPVKKGTISKDVWKEPLYMRTKNGQHGPKIKKVRIHVVSNNMKYIIDKNDKPYRAVEPKVKHHIELFESTDNRGRIKQEGKIISMYDAIQRRRRGESVVCRDYGDNKKFVCSLSRNEMFVLEDGENNSVLHRVQYVTLLPQGPRIVLRPHTYAGKVSESDKPPLIQRKTPNTLKGYKVTVDPIGRIFPASD